MYIHSINPEGILAAYTEGWELALLLYMHSTNLEGLFAALTLLGVGMAGGGRGGAM